MVAHVEKMLLRDAEEACTGVHVLPEGSNVATVALAEVEWQDEQPRDRVVDEGDGHAATS